MPVSPEDVLRLAEMTRVGLTAEEVSTLTVQIEAIVEHVSRLQEVDTSSVNDSPRAPDQQHVLREDVRAPSLTPEEVLANAPQRHGDFFVVPAVLKD